MTKRVFQECMALFGIAFDVEFNENNKTKLYWEYLKDIEDYEMKEATSEIIKEKKWFPKIAEIRKIVMENRNFERERDCVELEAEKIRYLSLPYNPEFQELSNVLGEKLDMNSPPPPIKYRPKTVKLRGRTSPQLTSQEFQKRKIKLQQQKKLIGVEP